MARIVQKFGGTSVGDLERIRNVAKKVRSCVEAGNEVVVVVSAMAGTTNQLVEWAKQIGPIHDAREYDTIVSTGEQVTVGLLSIALQNMGVDARSWLGWQVPIETDDVHSAARIEEINAKEIIQRLNKGQVAVVAGFQGIAPDGRISTLGRGGSDTSAVALAAAIEADRCDIFTDVEGVYTTDPRVMPKARKLDSITFEEMLEMASAGAKVLQTRSVAMAMRHGVNLQVLSSFKDTPGTLVQNEEKQMEKQKVSGIAYTAEEAKVTIVGLPDKPGIAARIFGALAEMHINVDMIVQSASADSKETDITFSLARADLSNAVTNIKNLKEELAYEKLVYDEKQINMLVISTSEIKISVLIQADYTELAVRSLHDAFGLDSIGKNERKYDN